MNIVIRAIYARLTATLTISAAASVCGCSSEPRAPETLDFGVYRNCQPKVPHLTVIKLPETDFSEGLTLRHSLCFDGMRYYSRVSFNEIDSYLVRRNWESFEWKMLDGDRVTVGADKPARHRGRSWVLQKGDKPDSFIVVNDAGDAYEYVSTKLASIQRANVWISLRYVEGLLVEVTRTSPSPTVLISIEYDKAGCDFTLVAYDQRLSISRNEHMSVTSCESIEDGSHLIFRYEKGLLTAIGGGMVNTTLRWGVCNHSYRHVIQPFPPVVIWDGRFEYHATIGGVVMTVHFTDTTSGRRGLWKLNMLSGMVAF